MSFWANVRFSCIGTSARDARVEVEVVYHHCFFVLGQRSVRSRDQITACFISVRRESYRLSENRGEPGSEDRHKKE